MKILCLRELAGSGALSVRHTVARLEEWEVMEGKLTMKNEL